MTGINTPAPARKKIRALIIVALLIAILAGTFFVPALAGSDEECREVCPTVCNSLTPWTWDWFWCQIFNPCYNTCHIPVYP
jgi:hypothetical protein